MTQAKPPSTPISTSKSSALSRTIDLVSRGYTRYISGRIPERKLPGLLRKLHTKYGIGCSPAQRLTRKKQGLANVALVVYLPSASVATPASTLASDSEAVSEAVSEANAAAVSACRERSDRMPLSLPVENPRPCVEQNPQERMAEWLLLVSPGSGVVEEEEALQDVVLKPRLVWLGYELVRLPRRGKSSWTWRRTKQEMADWYAILGEQLSSRKMAKVAQTLQRISRQPGFSGVRQQSWALIQFARSRGYSGEVPILYFLRKVSHGTRLPLLPQ